MKIKAILKRAPELTERLLSEMLGGQKKQGLFCQ